MSPEGRYLQQRCWILKFASKKVFLIRLSPIFFFTYLVNRLVEAIMEKFLEKLKIFALYAFSLLLMLPSNTEENGSESENV